MTPSTAGILARVMEEDHGRLLAALIGQLGDFQLAEDVLQDATEAALIHWGRSGAPDSPRAWLLKVARRKAIDRFRRDVRLSERKRDLSVLMAADIEPEPPEIPDDRLRLIFTCCHPALDKKSRIALTLRTLGGLTTAEIARAFLDKEATMGQRLSRAKAKIAAAAIPYEVPEGQDLAPRLGAVLAVIYLIFNEGYSASTGDNPIRIALCEEAIYLARMLDRLRTEEAEVMGLLALLLLTHARRPARVTPDGVLVALADQDRGLWDRQMIAEGVNTLDRALALNRTGPYQIKAAISALHGRAESWQATDWPQVRALYRALYRHEPTPVVRLNGAVAQAEGGDLSGALFALEALGDVLETYQPYHAALGEYLARSGRVAEAQDAFDRAITLSGTEAERQFLRRRRDHVHGL